MIDTVAKNAAFIDGQWYNAGDEVWDLGSLTATAASGRQRHYKGLSRDVPKLPHYVGTGSTAYCVDSGDVYMFEETTDTWYRQGTAQGGGDGTYVAYQGAYTVTPSAAGQRLGTANKLMEGDLTVLGIPYSEVSNGSGKTVTIG